jgi:hypothetical protein
VVFGVLPPLLALKNIKGTLLKIINKNDLQSGEIVIKKSHATPSQIG